LAPRRKQSNLSRTLVGTFLTSSVIIVSPVSGNSLRAYSGAEFAPNRESALNIICEEREEGWQITVDAPELARVLSRFGLRDEAALNNPQQELPNPRN
jgi:hypothetical protein